MGHDHVQVDLVRFGPGPAMDIRRGLVAQQAADCQTQLLAGTSRTLASLRQREAFPLEVSGAAGTAHASGEVFKPFDDDMSREKP